MPAFWVEAPDVRSGVVLYCSQSQGIGAVRRWVDVNLKKKRVEIHLFLLKELSPEVRR